VTTAAKPEDVAEAESVLPVEEIVDKAVANAEVVDCSYRPPSATLGAIRG
jgi:hypothetical protein